MPLRSSDTRVRLAIWALGGLLAVVAPAAPRAVAQEPAAREVPEDLNFANGLFRDRRYREAAEEYERFLKDAPPGPFANEGRFGLASARLFHGQYAEARKHFEAFLKAAPDHANAGTAWYRVGEAAFMLGDLPAAQHAMETYTEKYPKHRFNETAWPYLADVCLRLGDLPKARRAYEKALADFPKGRLVDRAKLGLGRTLAQQGETEAALKVLDDLTRTGGVDWATKAWFHIGQVRSTAGEYAQAVEAYDTLAKTAPQSPLLPEARLRRAEALLKLDRAAEAETALRGLIAADVSRNLGAQAAFALGTAQLERGQAAEALATLDDALKRFENTPLVPALLFRSAEAQQKLKQTDDARTRFLKASEIDPKDPWADVALLHAARLTLESGDKDAAKTLATAFPQRFPKSPLRADARLIEARVALDAGQAKEAIALLNASQAEDKPTPATAESQRYYLGLAYRADGQTDKAKELLDELATKSDAPVGADAQLMVAQGHIDAKRFGDAVPVLKKYLDTKTPREYADYALAHLARAHLELNQPEEAGKALDDLATRFPKSKTLAPTRLRMAEAALDAKQYDRAQELFRQVVESNTPELRARARSGLGWTLLESKKPAEAAEVFAALLDASPEDPLAPDAALACGRALAQAGQVVAALAAYTVTTTQYPKSKEAVAAQLERARLLLSAKRPEEAAPEFEKFLAEHPDPKKDADVGLDEVLVEWGWALADIGKTDEADKVFTRLLEEFPNSPQAADARFNLAESAAKAQQHDKVIALLSPLVAEGAKTSPSLVEPALFRMGRSQAEQKAWADSAKTLDRLLTEFPKSRYRRQARFLRANVALHGDDPKTAEASFAALAAEPIDANDPDGLPLATRRLRIDALLALGRWKELLEAADAFKRDAPEDPNMADVEYARGRALQSLSPPQFDDARAAYDAVIKARKGGDLAARAQLMRGETYYHQESYHEALREFLKVDILYDAPATQAAALLEAGKVYERLDQWADAVETYERLLSKFPKDPSASTAEPRLEAARKRVKTVEKKTEE